MDRVKRSLKLARVNKLPGIVAKVIDIREHGANVHKPTVLTALGLNMGPSDNSVRTAFIHTLAAVPIAQKLASVNQSTGTRLTDEAEVAARLAGELSAIQVFPNGQLTETEVLAARTRLCALIKSNPPKDAEMRSYFTKTLQFCKALGESFLPTEEATRRLGPLPNGYPPSLKAARIRFYELRGNIWKAGFLADDVWNIVSGFQTKLNMLYSNGACDLPDIPTIEMKEGWAAGWAGLSDEERLAYYEGLALIKSDVNEGTIVLSLLAFLTLLCKQGNATDAWCSKTVEALKRYFPQLTDNELIKVDSDFVRKYAELFPFRDESDEQLFAMIQAAFTICSDAGLDSLGWVLEQAAASNVTLAIEFCRAINRCQNTAYMVLYHNFKAQWGRLAKLVGELARNRFCSLRNPPVPMAEYADLAYMGKFISMQDRTHDKRITYKGDPTKYCVHSINDLEMLANRFIALSAQAMQEKMSAKNRLKDVVGGGENTIVPVVANRRFITVENETYMYDATVANTYRNSLTTNEAKREFDQSLQNLEREGWNRRVAGLPFDIHKVSDADMNQIEEKENAEIIKAMKMLCTTIESLSKQAPIDIIVAGRHKNTSPLKALDRELYDALNRLNAQLPEDYLVAGDDGPDVVPRGDIPIDVLHRGTLPIATPLPPSRPNSPLSPPPGTSGLGTQVPSGTQPNGTQLTVPGGILPTASGQSIYQSANSGVQIQGPLQVGADDITIDNMKYTMSTADYVQKYTTMSPNDMAVTIAVDGQTQLYCGTQSAGYDVKIKPDDSRMFVVIGVAPVIPIAGLNLDLLVPARMRHIETSAHSYFVSDILAEALITEQGRNGAGKNEYMLARTAKAYFDSLENMNEELAQKLSVTFEQVSHSLKMGGLYYLRYGFLNEWQQLVNEFIADEDHYSADPETANTQFRNGVDRILAAMLPAAGV